MGRKRGRVWSFFDEPIEADAENLKRAKCKHCDSYVTANINTLKKHVLNCDRVPPDHGIELPSSVLKPCRRKSATPAAGSTSTALLQSPASSKQPDGIASLKAKLGACLASAIHQTGLPVNVFDHPKFREFFSLLRPDYSLQTPDSIGSVFLDAEYASIVEGCKSELASWAVDVIGIRAADESAADMFVHCPNT